MSQRVNREAALPLYHQIAESIRHRIATGELKSGDRLLPVRDAAHELGVNLHTVRHAYVELVAEGLLETQRGQGTTVARRVRRAVVSNPLSAFLQRTEEAAWREQGLSVSQLARLLLRRAAGAGQARAPTVYFVECSETQSAGHCAELRHTWRVDARPWVLAEGEPPATPLLATYFHYNDVRQLWPQRLADIRFVAIRPDAGLPARIEPHRAGRGPTTLLVCELDEAKALNITADLSLLFPPDAFRLVPRVVARPGELIGRTRARELLLLSPRLWGMLADAERHRPGAFEIRYVIEPGELQALGDSFGWQRAPADVQERAS